MTHSQRKLCLLAALCCCITPAFGAIEFNDGGVHNIAYNFAHNFGSAEMWVDYDSPSMGTTVNLLDGSELSWGIAFGNSAVNILGGYVAKIIARDTSRVSISGGVMNEVTGWDDATIDISGGRMAHITGSSTGGSSGTLSGTSEINLSGGSIDEIHLAYAVKLNVSGGVVYGDLQAWDASQTTITGGFFGGGLVIKGASQVTIYGDGFNYPYGAIKDPVGTLIGTLANGDRMFNRFYVYDNASIVLVPEPATALLLAAGLLMMRRRT